jgi:hypothetical protein
VGAATVELQDGHVEDGAGDEEGEHDSADRVIDRSCWTAS